MSESNSKEWSRLESSIIVNSQARYPKFYWLERVRSYCACIFSNLNKRPLRTFIRYGHARLCSNKWVWVRILRTFKYDVSWHRLHKCSRWKQRSWWSYDLKRDSKTVRSGLFNSFWTSWLLLSGKLLKESSRSHLDNLFWKPLQHHVFYWL